MIRLASWIVFSLLVAALVAWLISLPGTMTIEVAGFIAQPRLGVAVALLLALIVLIISVWGIIRRILSTPHLLARHGRQRRRERGIAALSDAVIALHAGEPGRARDFAREARQHLSTNAAAQLVEARAHLALGDMAAAREHYRALIGNPKTAMAALSGLHEQARTQGRHAAALTFARQATALEPNTAWASSAVFDDLIRRHDWTGALAMVAATSATSRDERQKRKRRQAVLETAIARDGEATDSVAALDHALAAIKLQPDFVPAALIAARIEISRGEVRRAMGLLRKAFRITGHPDLATLYANCQPGASAVERLKRTRELIDMPPPNRPLAIVFARAAVDAYEWNLARQALAGFSTSEPTQGVALLMAEIEEGQSSDQGKAREWLGRAVRAPGDPAWTADGITATEWEPVSPVTGRLDAFQWKIPLNAVSQRNASAAAEESPDRAPPRPLPLPGH